MRLHQWSYGREPTTAWPTFIDAVASEVGGSASVTLLDLDGEEALVAVSGRTARIAHDVEFVMGEGPAHDVAATLRPLRVDGFDLRERWPRFGPAVAHHGVGSLRARAFADGLPIETLVQRVIQGDVQI